MLAVEKIRAKYFRRNDLNDIDSRKAREIKRDLRVGRTKLRKLPDSTPLKAEGLQLFDSTITAVDAIANSKPEADVLVEVNREYFERYVQAVESVIHDGS
jgi:hypothetical protein